MTKTSTFFCIKEAEHRFDVYTYNRSEIVMVDEDQNEMYNDDIDTSYNWDTREDKWIGGKSSYESVEFSCRAYFFFHGKIYFSLLFWQEARIISGFSAEILWGL